LAKIEVYLLGGFRVVVDGVPLHDGQWPRRAARRLFACLLTRPHWRLARDEAYQLFWPNSDAHAASPTLRSTVFSLRRTLEPGGNANDSIVVVDRDVIAIRRDADIWVAADEFERLCAESRLPDAPDDLLEAADRLYAGDYLPDNLYDVWASPRRTSLRLIWSQLQSDLSQSRERRGDVDGAIACLRRLLTADPHDERAGRELMALLARHGRRTEAIRVYQQLVNTLHTDLGVEPASKTIELQRQVVAGTVPIPHAETDATSATGPTADLDVTAVPDVTSQTTPSSKTGEQPPLSTDANQLTERELEVERLLARGLTLRQIAETLEVSESTVETDILNLNLKLGPRSEYDVLARAILFGRLMASDDAS
jgi:DNA-binding SARP family transcriptional activator/DNA-binding CsgD family transcriptional regulator